MYVIFFISARMCEKRRNAAWDKSNCIINESYNHPEVGEEKRTDLNHFGKQCFDWVLLRLKAKKHSGKFVSHRVVG